MGTNYKDSKNTNSEKEGDMYQDFISDALTKELGWTISIYKSKKYQFEKGESRQGVEIKLDNWCSRSKRLSVETEEKTELEKSFVKSGIYRKDNSIIYIQGNYEIIFIFAKGLLQMLHNTKKYEEKEDGTFKSFYLPFKDAYRYAIAVIDLSNKKEEHRQI